MGRKGRPNLNLPQTGRWYVEDTIRARLASPGIERFPSAKGGTGPRVVLAAVGILALLAGLVWLFR